MKRIFLVLILLVVTGCAKPKSPFPIYEATDPTEGRFPIKYVFIDIPAEQRIEINFHNASKLAVCIYPNQWPTNTGRMQGEGPGMIIIVGKQRFTAEMTTPDYCPGCAYYVKPGENLRASIHYEVFHLPKALYNSKKRLEFNPMGYHCKET